MGKKRIVILGGGESGVGSAVLAKVKGFDVFLSDAGNIKPQYKETLSKFQIDYEEGGHTEEKILCADEVVKSPGIPEENPIDGHRLVVGGILRHQESGWSFGKDFGSESMAVMIFIISEGEVASRRSWTREVSAQRRQIR